MGKANFLANQIEIESINKLQIFINILIFIDTNK